MIFYSRGFDFVFVFFVSEVLDKEVVPKDSHNISLPGKEIPEKVEEPARNNPAPLLIGKTERITVLWIDLEI